MPTLANTTLIEKIFGTKRKVKDLDPEEKKLYKREAEKERRKNKTEKFSEENEKSK